MAHHISHTQTVPYGILCGFLLLLFGCQKTSNPPAPPPPVPPKPARATIVTTQVSGIHFDSAYAGGVITLNGDTATNIQSGICIDSLPSPDLFKITVVNTVNSGAFQCVVAPLNSNKAYHVRAFMRQTTGVTYGQDVTFTAFNYPPPVGNFFFTGPVESLTADKSGNIYAGGIFYSGEFYGIWSSVAKFNGVAWGPSVGVHASSDISYLYTGLSGAVYAAYANFDNGVDWDISQLNGNNWSSVGIYNSYNFRATAICADKIGNVYTIGNYTNANGKYYVA